MKNQKGFSLIELMIVVAIIGIIAAIAIPALLRARIAANESGAKSDLKATTSSTVTYANGNNGAYPSTLRCMGQPVGGGCPVGSLGAWPAGTAAFLDPLVGCVANTPGVLTADQYLKSGYKRTHAIGAPSAGIFDYGVVTWTMIADPITLNNTGTMYFESDHTGLVCQKPLVPFLNDGVADDPGCQPIGG